MRRPHGRTDLQQRLCAHAFVLYEEDAVGARLAQRHIGVAQRPRLVLHMNDGQKDASASGDGRQQVGPRQCGGGALRLCAWWSLLN